MQSGQIQKRLLAEKELTLQRATELAQGMEAATKQSSELRMPGGTVSGSHEIHLQTAGKPCYRCGSRGHPQEKCHFRTQKCNNCGKKGHIAKVCKSPPKSGDKKVPPHNPSKPKVIKGNHFVEQPQVEEEFGMFTVKQSNDGIIVELLIDGIPVKMTLDTGAAVSVISSEMCQELLPQLTLKQSNLLLKTYTGEPLKLEGEATVNVNYQGQRFTLPLVVVTGNGPPLLGRNWLQHVKLNWK